MKLSETAIFKIWARSDDKLLELEGKNLLDFKTTEESKIQQHKFILRIYSKVWSGFTKFIRSQSVQGRAVDTGMFGLVYMDDSRDNYQNCSDNPDDSGTFYYQPSIKFWDETGVSLNENEYNVNPYTSLNKQVIKMNIPGIASVCNWKIDTVSHVLEEFSKRIYGILKQNEVNQQMIVINLRIGYLKIKGQKVRFLNLFETKNKVAKTIADNKKNEVLSQHSDAVSWFVESIAASNRASSVHRSKHSTFNGNYSVKSSHKRINSQFSNRLMRFNSPILQGREFDLNDREKQSIEKIAKTAQKLAETKEKTNWPVHIDGTPIFGERFSKQMFFKSRSNEKDVFNENITLIRQRAEQKKLHTLISKQTDKDYLWDMEEYNQHEKNMEQIVKQQFKQDYTDYNTGKAKMKQKLIDHSFQARRQENFEFFPFTEGERVEHTRAEHKKELNKELREKSRQLAMPNILDRTGQSRTKERYRSTINSQGYSPKSEAIVNNLFTSTANSSGGFNMNIPNSIDTSYPKFLEPHKHYPYRRLNDTHIENVMHEAVKRVEDQVKDIKHRRIKQSEDFDRKFTALLKSAENHNLLKQKDTKFVQECQINQMETKAKVKNFFEKEDKMPQNIYYGPDEKGYTDLSKTYKEAKTKYDAEKMRKNDLKRQIDDKRRTQYREKQKERLQEIDHLWVSGKVMAKEFKEARDKEKIAIDTYKNVWKEQMKINKKRDIIREEGGEKIQ